MGWAVWLRLPEVKAESDGDDADGEWTSRAFVGTRVSTASHTFCGCQFMRGNSIEFRLTEHGRAQLPIFETQGGAPWYLNMTRAEIDAQIIETCHPFSTQLCPKDNETAYHEWESRKDNGTYWTLPPWLEIYGSLPQ